MSNRLNVESTSAIATQTSASLSSCSPRKQKLKLKVRTLQRKMRKLSEGREEENKSMDQFHEMCLRYLPQDLADFVRIQAELNMHKAKGRRYSAQYKKFALSLYFLGPRAYNFFKKLFLLPSIRSLERITKDILYRPGLDNDVSYEALKIKTISLLEQDRHCLLCIDEMSLKANRFYNIGRDEIIGMKDLGIGEKEFIPAQNVTVIMARGL
ncbi:uncharacterized protein LOC123688837 [Harmonia axyridis]|uniref:uncharacterized protein LOC123688837 n=1 Tax=Harmonia axyridis TaxID=115357 RepID=UPI001E277984|nr:uncharacterized protein LOC123688837 [Harmonia axyridis]XP_045483519.1 uncharacterized protein LOC123688837 [Harmonia axyridis]